MSKTPDKNERPTYNFLAKETSPFNKEHPEISKTVFDHVSNLRKILSDWLKVTDKGTSLCKTISALKLHECKDDYYPHQLKAITEGLVSCVDSLKDVFEGVEIITRQLYALARLHSGDKPVILTWSTKNISEFVANFYRSLKKEYELKKVITENIAHCRNEQLLEVYATAWEMDVYLDIDSTSYLFAEVGLPGIT